VTQSAYQPNDEVKKLFAGCQRDYHLAWMLQHRAFDEFDGVSLLERARVDQQTFGASVGAQYTPEHKRWRAEYVAAHNYDKVYPDPAAAAARSCLFSEPKLCAGRPKPTRDAWNRQNDPTRRIDRA
jgi:hypothetical protein